MHHFFSFFWIPYSLGNFRTKFEIFSQSAQQVGNWISWFFKLFLGVEATALCLILIGCHSFKLGIMNYVFCWISYSIRNFLA